jgi:HlyD family secretion protein
MDFLLRSLSRRTLAIATLAAVIAVAAFAAWRIAAGPSIAAYAVVRADLVQTVVASGRVESPRRVEIGSPVVGTVASVPVEEGQAVGAGQLLIALDVSEAQAAVVQARASVVQAEAKLAQIANTSLPVAVESVRQAQVNVENAERSLKRQQDLFDKGFVGQAVLDEARRARDVAASQLVAAKLQNAAEAAGGSDERLARAALQQARAALRAAEAHLEQMTVEAPVAGVLITRGVERGNVVQPGMVLMTLSPAGETQLVVQIDEKNLGLLRTGQKALASADAYPNERFEAEVAYINPGVDASRGSVEVKLSVPKPPAYLLQDMTVSVDIMVARAKDVLALPSETLHDGNWVLVARDGHARRQAVKVGAHSEGRIEVTEGVREGELVFSSSNPIAEGAPIRARPQPQPTRRS